MQFMTKRLKVGLLSSLSALAPTVALADQLPSEQLPTTLYKDTPYHISLDGYDSKVAKMLDFYQYHIYDWAGVRHNLPIRAQHSTAFRVLTDNEYPELVLSENMNPENHDLRRRLGLQDDRAFYQKVLVYGLYNSESYSNQSYLADDDTSPYAIYQKRGHIPDWLMKAMTEEYKRAEVARQYFDANNNWSEADYKHWKLIESRYLSLKGRYDSERTGQLHVYFMIDDDAKISQDDINYLKDAVNRLPKSWAKRLGCVHITGERLNASLNLNGVLGATGSDNVLLINGNYRSLVATLYHEASHVLDFQSMYYSKKYNTLKSFSRDPSFQTVQRLFINNPKLNFTNYYKHNAAEGFAQVLSDYYFGETFTDDEVARFGTVHYQRDTAESTKNNHYAKRYIDLFKKRYLEE